MGIRDWLDGLLGKDTYSYELSDGHKIVYRGITNEPYRRELEHKRSGKEFDRMRIEEQKRKRDYALKHERESLEKYKKNHHGQLPGYNKRL